MSKKHASGPHKRIYNFHKYQKPRKESRRICPDCGALLAPGKECTCQYGASTDNYRFLPMK